MSLFVISLLLLIIGYTVYGAIVEKIAKTIPGRPTPATTEADGVDFVPMPAWRVFLIQFLNIAGLGPIFGAIMGVMFGPAAFLWIVFGTIFGGAVHDFLSALMSLRQKGASLPDIVAPRLGEKLRPVITLFTVLLLLLVCTVFVVTPAGIIASMTPEWMDSTFWIGVIFTYYVAATLLPVDKVIGRIYPVFGVALLFMALGLMCCMLFGNMDIPVDISAGFGSRHAAGASTHPVFPIMFVSIACGAISGFHATQSPMMARCITNERLVRPVFYGAMVAEGIVALIWAAATIAFTGGYEGIGEYMADPTHSPGTLVKEISFAWLGQVGGLLALIGVVAAPITTGDTALRSARLVVAEAFRVPQSKLYQRLSVSAILFAVVIALTMMDFNVLWRYFACSNQILAAITLWAAAIWLARKGSVWIIAALPAAFMTAVCVTYILFAPRPEGFGIDLNIATAIGITAACVASTAFALSLRANKKLLVE